MRRKGERERERLLTDVLEDINDEKRRDQVVDALHVAAGWVADGPDEQDPLENLSAHTKKQSKSTLSRNLRLRENSFKTSHFIKLSQTQTY